MQATSGTDRQGPDDAARLLLTLDTGSPVTSVAVGRGTKVLAHSTSTERHSSERLLELMRQALDAAGLSIDALHGIVALQGPGSFTGLRIGLATAWGLHQATGLAATAVPTLEVLAESATEDQAVAVIDALRGEWIAQPFRRREGSMQPTGDARRLESKALSQFAPSTLVGFGVSGLHDALPAAPKLRLQEPVELATHTLRHVALRPPAWDPDTLTQPIYYRPPAAKRAQS